MISQAVTDTIQTLADVQNRFNLRRTEDISFFREWYENLPELSQEERESLDIIRRRYLYHLAAGSLSEGTVTLLLGAPLLEKAGFYDPPFRMRGEASIEIVIPGENPEEEILRGRMDVLVVIERVWVIVLESKRTGIALNAALPQLLAYMMGCPNRECPIFGIIINGDGVQFAKVVGGTIPQFDVSDVFSPVPARNGLYSVLQILKRIGTIILDEES
ncbi:MAG: type I restriction endonuclease subunit R [Cyanobacteria bacterium SBLK]|nr:type I restriction endonuclease subunit R [Cyanobacteria bacterium SBLK]